MSPISERCRTLEFDADHVPLAVVFTADGEHLVSAGSEGVRVWQVRDGKQVAAMRMEHHATCVAVSNDGRWIAAGTERHDSKVLVWDTKTYEQVFVDKPSVYHAVWGVDFSPDSSHLVSADGGYCTVTIWDPARHKKVRALQHNALVHVARYSPRGDLIAATSDKSVRVWDSNDGRLLVEAEGNYWEESLLWSDKHLFAVARSNEIRKIDAATGSTISAWSVPHANKTPRIALPYHGRFIAYSTPGDITFWSTSERSQVGLIRHGAIEKPAIAFSLDDRLAIARMNKRIIIRNLSCITEPEVRVDGAALDSWRHGRLADAEASLTAAIQTSRDPVDSVLASRALVRSRLQQWDAALVDAEESIKIRKSVMGYIAKCAVLVGKGETQGGCRVCDIAFLHFPPNQVSILLLIKAVVLFMAGEYDDAMSRMDDLIATVGFDSMLYVVQAHMHFLYGNLHMESGDYNRAVRSFEDARVKLGNHAHSLPLIILLITGWKFDDLAITIQQHLCECLFAAGRTKDAGESVLHMMDQETNVAESVERWASDFKSQCRGKLEGLGDSAMNARQYDETISHYTGALSLDPPAPQSLLVKRSRAHAAKGMWKDLLNDANEIIKLEPSSPLGYERKHEALRGAGCHADAVDAFEMMLLKMSQSPDPEIREQSHRYVPPEQTKKAIRTAIRRAIRDSPLVLLNAISGRLCDKTEQAIAFESTPTFLELVTTMTGHIDHARIEHEVKKFYRYTTFSHTWEGDEPLFDKVTRVVVYDLEASPTHDKLQMFCRIVREEGFNWAWSDTCCINKGDHFMLQEALVSMFKWYEGSAMTIIFLRGVPRTARPGALVRSIWNTRGWTLQEYHASRVVRFYTEDWTPYLGLDAYNHKDSPAIISEMEEATGISAQALMAFHPGLYNIRDKLHLASTRDTTRIEDAAYSLLGIFSMSLPITYGEGDKALGRLLAQLLTSSGDTSILAWTGISGSFNSCLPAHISVFRQLQTSHIPPAYAGAKMNAIVDGLDLTPSNLTLVTELYNRLLELPVPSVLERRLKLPCFAFKLGRVSNAQHMPGGVFRAHAGVLGAVEIRTEEDISQFGSLYLIHPWIDFLLDRKPVGNVVETTPEEDDYSVIDVASLPGSPSIVSPVEKQLNALQFIVRLGQPFGALLFTPTRQHVEEYKRVATDSLITAQVKEITSGTLEELIRSVRMLDVL